MDAKLAFHRAFKHYGPPVTDQNLKLVGLDHVVNDLRNINSEIFCGYIDKQEFNAIAALHSDIELVGFFAGLTLYLFFYFDTLLSDPNVFPDIGDRSKEKLDQSRIESFRNPFLSLHSVRALARPPICEIRAQVARDLVTCAHYFIFAHEV